MTIVDVLEQLGVAVKRPGEARSVRGGWVGCPCPYCGHGSSDAYLGFPVDGWFASCWTCGSHPLGKTLMLLSGRPWKEVKVLLGDRDTAVREEKPRGVLKLPNGIEVTDQPKVDPGWPRFAEYLRSRNVAPFDAVRLWHVRGIDWRGGRLAWRLFLPVEYLGKVVSWTTRTIGDRQPRYISAAPDEEAIDHKTLLFGHDLVRTAAVVVEGPLDAMRVGPGAVATFGTGWTSGQIAKLAAVPVRAICFDSEPAAQKRARELARALEVFPGKTEVVTLETGNDPGDADAAEIAELRKRYLED